MKSDIKAAVVQYQLTQNPEDSENKIKELVSSATFKNIDIIGLPEGCLGNAGAVKNGYDPFGFLSSVASKHKMYLFGATYHFNEEGQLFNSGFLYSDSGELLLLQNKIVLTPPEIEDGFVPGSKIQIVETKFGRLAILVCKDSFHRYAAWFFDAMMKAKVDVVLIPSYSITVSERSINLWSDTLKTMSMLFNVFILAPGTIGKNGIDGMESFGHALIISPQKVVLAEGSQDKKEILYATLEKKDLDRLRSPEAEKWQPSEVPEFNVEIV